MKYSFRLSLVSSASIAAIALSCTGAALAQDQQAQRVTGLEEVTVTARRVEENLQRVPISVVALNEADMVERQVFDTAVLQKVVPGFVASVGDSDQYIWMRGMQGIASFFANAPFTLRTEGQNFDIGSFQVLKGPQGTRFGQSSAAGAVVVEPRRPVNATEGFVNASTGTYGLRHLQGAVNFPILDDKLLFRLAGDSFARNGYVLAKNTGKKYHDENYFTIRPSLVWKVTDSIENYTMLSYYHNRNNGRVFIIDNYKPGGLMDATSPAGFADVVAQTFAPPTGSNRYVLDNVRPTPGFSGEKDKTLFVVNETIWDVMDNISIKNIFSYRSSRRRSVGDSAYDVNAPLLGIGAELLAPDQVTGERESGLLPETYWSDELIVSASLWDDRLDLDIGTFHTAGTQPYYYNFGSTFGVLSSYVGRGDRRKPTRSRAVYGSASVDLSDKVLDGLTLELGIRKTWDSHKEQRWFLAPDVSLDLADWPMTRFDVQSANFSYENWLVGLQYQVTQDTMVFITGSQGVTYGQVILGLPADLQIVYPEKLRNIEAGVKSTFTVGDWEFRTNVSGYYGWWLDIQAQNDILYQSSPPPAPPIFIAYSDNAAEGLVRGVDFSIDVVPTDWLEFGFNGAWNKNKYTTYAGVDPQGNPLDFTNQGMVGRHDFKYVANATVHLPIDPAMGHLSVTANWMHQSREMADGGRNDPSAPEFLAITEANGYPARIADGQLRHTQWKPANGELDLSMSWSDVAGTDGLRVVASITNVLKQTTSLSGGNAWTQLGASFGQARPPRMFSMGVQYNF